MTHFDVLRHHKEESRSRNTPDLKTFYLYRTHEDDVFTIVEYNSEKHYVVLEHEKTKKRFIKIANMGGRVFDVTLQDVLYHWNLETPLGLEVITRKSGFSEYIRYPEFRKGLNMPNSKLHAKTQTDDADLTDGA